MPNLNIAYSRNGYFDEDEEECKKKFDLEQIGVRASADKGNKLNFVSLLIDQKPIWRNMTLSMACVVARKSMVSVLSRQLLSTSKFTYNINELVNVKPPFLRQFYIFVILPSSLNIIAHTCAS